MKNIHNNVNKKRIYFFLYFIFFIMLFYAIQDFQTSHNTGIRDADRRGVYLSLFVMLFFLGIYYLYGILQRGIVRGTVKKQLWFIVIWVTIVNLIQDASLWSSLVHIGLAILWILIYSFFSYHIRKFPNSWFHIKLCIMIMFWFYVFATVYSKYNMQTIYNRKVVINMAYNVLVFLPWILLISKNKLRRFNIGIIFIVILISFKRGAIIALPLMISIHLIVDGIINHKYSSAILKVIFTLILFSAVFLIFDKCTGGYLRARFSHESLASGSGRDQLYKYAIEDIKQRTVLDFMIGRGSGSSVQLLGTGVHNEWLEFFFSFGIIGTILYLSLFISLFRQIYKLIKISSPYASVFTAAFVYMFVVGMFGGIYFVHTTLYIMALFGTVEGLVINDIKKDYV